VSLMQNHPFQPFHPHHHVYMQIFRPANIPFAAHSHSGPVCSSSNPIDLISSASPQTRIHLSAAASAPRMLQHLADRDPFLDIAIEHQPDQIDALLAHNPWHAQIVVHDLVNAIERVFLVDDGVQQDTERPNILLFATIRPACEDFGCSVVCCVSALLYMTE
jgi:hypothetical protein